MHLYSSTFHGVQVGVAVKLLLIECAVSLKSHNEKKCASYVMPGHYDVTRRLKVKVSDWKNQF